SPTGPLSPGGPWGPSERAAGVVEHPPISSSSDNVPVNSDFFILFLPYRSPGQKRCRRKRLRTAKMVLTARTPRCPNSHTLQIRSDMKASCLAAAWQARGLVMAVDTPRYRFHNSKEADIPLTPRKTSLEQALEEAVSRALRDNLAPLQRTADELHHAYGDLVAACSSSRPSNALPALLRAQTAASALAAGLSVLSNFVAVALSPREQHSVAGAAVAAAVADEDEEIETPEEVEPAAEASEEV